jgi:hypothetical protein
MNHQYPSPSEQEITLFIAQAEGDDNPLNLNVNDSEVISDPDFNLQASFFRATFHGLLDIVKVLLTRGAKINAQTNFGQTALMIACEKGHSSIVSFLLSQGARKHLKQNTDNNTALHLAAKNGHITVVNMLLEFGARHQMLNYFNETPLNLADDNHHKEILLLLTQVRIARFEAEQCNLEFFKNAIVTDTLVAPRQWLFSLSVQGINDFSLWVHRCISDEEPYFAFFTMRHWGIPKDIQMSIFPFLGSRRYTERRVLRNLKKHIRSFFSHYP